MKCCLGLNLPFGAVNMVYFFCCTDGANGNLLLVLKFIPSDDFKGRTEVIGHTI